LPGLLVKEEKEIRGLFVEAFVDHLKSLEWDCLH